LEKRKIIEIIDFSWLKLFLGQYSLYPNIVTIIFKETYWLWFWILLWHKDIIEHLFGKYCRALEVVTCDIVGVFITDNDY
jgi:hypothetical protein